MEDKQAKSVSLEHLSEAEWMKYKRMNSIAYRENLRSLAWGAGMVAFVVLFVYAVFYGTNLMSKVQLAVNYTSANLNKSLSNFGLNATNFNKTSSAKLGSVLATNQTILAQYALYNVSGLRMLALLTFTFTLFVLIVAVFVYTVIFMPWGELPSGYQELQRRFRYIERAKNKLKAHGFSNEEIEWFFSVRRELILKNLTEW